MAFLLHVFSICEPVTQQLAAYGQIIIHLYQKHKGSGWLAYDKLFRLQKAAGASTPWSEINPSLMASTVLGNASIGLSRSCTLCGGSDHDKTSCALASLAPSSAYSQRQVGRQSPTTEFCRRYNRGHCPLIECRFLHICSICTQRHQAVECPLARSKLAPSKEKAGPPTSKA